MGQHFEPCWIGGRLDCSGTLLPSPTVPFETFFPFETFLPPCVTQKNQSQENQFLERRNVGSVPNSSQVKFGTRRARRVDQNHRPSICREADN
jgi:hypothetical protein